MQKWKFVALSALLTSLSSFASPITIETSQPNLNSARSTWVKNTQAIKTCIQEQSRDKCVTAYVPQGLGKVSGIINLNPVINSTSSWLAFTDKKTALCGMQFSTKKMACAEVLEMSDKLVLAYQTPRVRLADVFVELQPALQKAANQVKRALSSPYESSSRSVLESGGTVTPAAKDGTGDCGDGCDEDMPIVIVIGDGGAGGGGGGGGGGGVGGVVVRLRSHQVPDQLKAQNVQDACLQRM